MTMLDLTPVQTRALDHLVCITCSGPMVSSTDRLNCERCGTTYRVDEHGIVRVLTTPPSRMNPAVRIGQWSWIARLYDALWRTRALTLLTGESFGPKREIDLVADSLQLERGNLFLDNACANGFYARNIAQRLHASGRSGVVFAVDASLPMLRRAKQLAQREGVADRIVFVHADSEHLPFSDGTFDGITCGGSLNEFVSPESVLRELRRVLDPRSGALSLMFQVRGTRGIQAVGQRLLGPVLGLTVRSLRESVELVRTYFDPEVRFFGGMVLILKCTSRVQTVAHQPVLKFSPAAAE